MPKAITKNDLPIDSLIEDFKSSMSLKDISIKYNISKPTLRKILNELGLKRFGRISSNTINMVLSYKDYHVAKIATILSIDPKTVSLILKNNNIIPARKKFTKTKVSKTRYEQFVEEFTVDEISSLLSKSMYHACISTGYSEVIVRRYAKENNISFNKAFLTIKDLSKESANSIRSLFKENLYSNKEIQEMFGIGNRTLRKITKDVKKNLIDNTEFENYKKVVRRLTTVVKNLYEINPPNKFHVDHKLSVYDGFKLGIPPYLIASAENLEIISADANLRKGSTSSITKEELYILLKI